MSNRSAIEWTETTWNPTTGCDQVSLGCDNCYALSFAKRLKAMGQPKYQNDGDPRTSGPGFGLTLHREVLLEPRRWRAPKLVFVNSMSDLFSPRSTYRVHSRRVYRDGGNTAAHLPGSHQAFQATCLGRPRVGMAPERLDGCERRKPIAMPSASTTSEPCQPKFASSAPNLCWVLFPIWIFRASTG